MSIARLLTVALLVALYLLARRALRRSPALPAPAPQAATGRTLLYFCGPRCAACATAKPLITALARDTPELQLRIIDANEQPAEARRWAIMTVPTVILLDHAGEITYRASGSFSPHRLRQAVGEPGKNEEHC